MLNKLGKDRGGAVVIEADPTPAYLCRFEHTLRRAASSSAVKVVLVFRGADGFGLGSRIWGQNRFSAPGKERARSFY